MVKINVIRSYIVCFVGILVAACSSSSTKLQHKDSRVGLNKIQHIVIIYAENRSFDNLYGEFPNANGIKFASTESRQQIDTDGHVLPYLPPTWLVKSKKNEENQADNSYPTLIRNAPYKLNALRSDHQLSNKTRDLVHRFYQNQEQINEGKNNRFASVSDSGGLSMGYYDGSSLAMWRFAQEFTLADNFFMGAFGGSFLNHLYLVCACAPEFKHAPDDFRIKLDNKGHLLRADNSPTSALLGPPQYVADNSVTPDGYAVNTVQPPYQPSGIVPESINRAEFADSHKNPLPPQTIRTIGDALSEKNVNWRWYSGGWDEALKDGMQSPEESRNVIYSKVDKSLMFQAHHQPFNYFKNFAPGTRERADHIRDGNEFIQDIEKGKLPAVAFYKPAGENNEHPGYTDVLSGDQHIADMVTKIRASSAWSSTVIIVTYDENGGFWDHVSPPKGDRWGPGTRIPAIVISPFAKRNYIDHTTYDTGSIIKFITLRFGLAPIDGVRSFVGDLTNALEMH
jgi:acid phosphatase